MRPGATRYLLGWFAAVVIFGYWHIWAGVVVGVVGWSLLTWWCLCQVSSKADEANDRLLHDLQEGRDE